MASEKVYCVSNITIEKTPDLTNRLIKASWNFRENDTKMRTYRTPKYSFKWYYYTADKLWFEGSSGEVEEPTFRENQSSAPMVSTPLPWCTYEIPENAQKIKIKIKPIAKEHEVKVTTGSGKNKTEKTESQAWYSAGWKSSDSLKVSSLLPSALLPVGYEDPIVPQTPGAPNISISGYKLLATLDVNDSETKEIEYQVVVDNNYIFSSGNSSITFGYSAYSCVINLGHEYKVRCRAYGEANVLGQREVSEWSSYSQPSTTGPGTIGSITDCSMISATSIKIGVAPVGGAEQYIIQWAKNVTDFNIVGMYFEQTIDSPILETIINLDGDNLAGEWFFRYKATNSIGVTDWSQLKSVIVGLPPAPPTTWSNITSATVGDIVNLYWSHNSEDGSAQTAAILYLNVNGVNSTIPINGSQGFYELNTSSYSDGASISWCVKTKGVYIEYSNESVVRNVDIFAPPTLTLTLSNQNNWYWDSFNFKEDTIYTAYGETGVDIGDTLTSFPLVIKGISGPLNQTPNGYTITIIANESYDTIDETGNIEHIAANSTVYSKYLEPISRNLFDVLTPGDINLDDDISYTVKCKVAMNSGLSAEAVRTFTVEWEDIDFSPNAETIFDSVNSSMYIKPYCLDLYGEIVDDVWLSVYRREYNGELTAIATNIDSRVTTFITDPHPSLDYARYRIVATSKDTGGISFYDLPGYPIKDPAIIIQWDEEWSIFDHPGPDAPEKPSWNGSLVRLPYNVDISTNNNIDVSFVEYIGRNHPVSYYGTQVGEQGSWSADIPADDEDTLYALRRLSVWPGDVYVREPSGIGYWANVVVSMSQTHCEVTIPVSLDITRVDGGM